MVERTHDQDGDEHAAIEQPDGWDDPEPEAPDSGARSTSKRAVAGREDTHGQRSKGERPGNHRPRT